MPGTMPLSVSHGTNASKAAKFLMASNAWLIRCQPLNLRSQRAALAAAALAFAAAALGIAAALALALAAALCIAAAFALAALGLAAAILSLLSVNWAESENNFSSLTGCTNSIGAFPEEQHLCFLRRMYQWSMT